MPAPSIRIALLPSLVTSHELQGTIAVVIDQLRATTTITQALASGARCVVPFLEPEHARAHQCTFPSGQCLTGGERHGVLIDGFNHDNSPRAYTREAVADKCIAFTTTNGTVALHHASSADRVLIACLGNLSAVAHALASANKSVTLICAGTLGRVTQEDALVAALIASKLTRRGFTLTTADPRADDDTAPMLVHWAQSIENNPSAIAETIRHSRGGRNLTRIGLTEDVDFCTQVDLWPHVPEYHASKNKITLAI
jgi:2-phosphosulfolactate phosphatase